MWFAIYLSFITLLSPINPALQHASNLKNMNIAEDIPPILPLSQSDSSTDTVSYLQIPLHLSSSRIYASMSIGNENPQKLHLLPDIRFQETFLFYSQSGGEELYKFTPNETTDENGNVHYNHSVERAIYTSDEFNFGLDDNKQNYTLRFLAVNATQQDNQTRPFPNLLDNEYAGVIGLSYSSTFMSMISDKQKNIISIFLNNPIFEISIKSHIHLGGYNEKDLKYHEKGEIVWIKAISTNPWELKLNDVIIGESTSIQSNANYIEFDITTQYFSVPTMDFAQILKELQNYIDCSDIQATSNQAGKCVCVDTVLDQMPQITLSLDAYDIKISPYMYLKLIQDSTKCTLNIVPMSGLSGWIMGYILFQNYYVIFNGEKVNDHKIGLVITFDDSSLVSLTAFLVCFIAFFVCLAICIILMIRHNRKSIKKATIQKAIKSNYQRSLTLEHLNAQ